MKQFSYKLLDEPYQGEDSFAYVSLKERYQEQKGNIKHTTNFMDLVNEIHDESTSTYEVISKDNSPKPKIYVDIERIPIDKPDLIREIINALVEYFGVSAASQTLAEPPNIQYVVSINPGSKYGGLSYHIIFQILAQSTLNIRNMIINFNNLHQEFADYIDENVYSQVRLFRTLYSYSIEPVKKDSVHVPFIMHTDNEAPNELEILELFTIQKCKGLRILSGDDEYQVSLKNASRMNAPHGSRGIPDQELLELISTEKMLNMKQSALEEMKTMHIKLTNIDNELNKRNCKI